MTDRRAQHVATMPREKQIAWTLRVIVALGSLVAPTLTWVVLDVLAQTRAAIEDLYELQRATHTTVTRSSVEVELLARRVDRIERQLDARPVAPAVSPVALVAPGIER